MIRLRNEGPLQPPPQLDGHAEQVSTELQSWPDMISATHWMRGDSTKIDGAEFHVREGGELGHIHLNGEIHVALTRKLREALVTARLAHPFMYHDAWITAPIRSAADGQLAAWLFRLAYDRVQHASEAQLIGRIREQTASSCPSV